MMDHHIKENFSKIIYKDKYKEKSYSKTENIYKILKNLWVYTSLLNLEIYTIFGFNKFGFLK